jgi:D-sedoheptulose 7-phosphate isomerase
MDNMNFINDYLKHSLEVKSKLVNDDHLLSTINTVTELIENAYRTGGKLLIAGNGGSAADAQHLAAELVSRFFYDRPGLPALALTTDTSMLTAIGNDYGFENLFSRQMEAQGVAGDVFIGITTSGNSPNIIKAIEVAKTKDIVTIALCGNAGDVSDVADYSIEVPSNCTPYIQECHICIGHIICALIEKNIFPREH